MLTQIHAAYGFIVHNGIRIALGQYRAVADDVGAVTNTERFTHIVVGDQHADTALGQKLDDALNVNHGNRVNAGEGLVKQYETRVGRQRTGDFHTAAFATG